jgi:hypothetical protein
MTSKTDAIKGAAQAKTSDSGEARTEPARFCLTSWVTRMNVSIPRAADFRRARIGSPLNNAETKSRR